jgi:hypothetical protein
LGGADQFGEQDGERLHSLARRSLKLLCSAV